MPESITRRSALIGAGGATAISLLAACGSSAPAGATPSPVASGETLVMIVRHAEKPKGSHAPYGVTADGDKDDESLTVTGWTRAGALVELFDPAAPLPLRTGLARPHRVIAAKPGGGSSRPLETVTPTAARLGTKPDTRWSVGQEKELAKAVDALTGVTLIAWEHKHIPDIAAALGHVSPTPPGHWPGHRFDVVWCFRRHGSGWTFYQVPELLLAGDEDSGI